MSNPFKVCSVCSLVDSGNRVSVTEVVKADILRQSGPELGLNSTYQLISMYR